MAWRYHTYPEYKLTETDWLGEAPTHWKTIPVGRLFRRIKRTGFTESELLSVYRDYGVIPKSSREDNFNKPSEDLTPYQLVQENDLVMNKMKTWQGSIAISEFEGIVSPAYFVYQPLPKLFDVAHSKYVHYLLRNPMYIAQYLRRSKGIRVNQWDLDPDEFQRIELLLPDKDEQLKIFQFLDYETAKIDTLIEKQQQLIKLLKEKRQAVISHAVTKGLNPNAPMRDSGVEWLGEVPEHWVTKKTGYACQIDNNLRTPIDVQTRAEISGEYPYYGPTGILSQINKYNVEGKYFLLSEDGDHVVKFKEKPQTIYVEGRFNVNNHAHLIKGKGSCLTKWASLYYEHKDLFPWVIKQGVGRYKLRKESLVEIPILVPPVEEQEYILSEISRKKETLGLIERRAESLITFLLERRTALISSAVTGKIDVRDWKAPVDSRLHGNDVVEGSSA